MAEVRQQMGNGPVYISFDIDGLDPAFAPGTGKCFYIVPLLCTQLLTFPNPNLGLYEAEIKPTTQINSTA